MFDDVETLLPSDVAIVSSSFPPQNILKLDESRYVVELAVAGFSTDEIDITIEDGSLTVYGEKKEKESPRARTATHSHDTTASAWYTTAYTTTTSTNQTLAHTV